MNLVLLVALFGCASTCRGRGPHSEVARSLRDAIIARDLPRAQRAARRLEARLPDDPGLARALDRAEKALDTTMAAEALGEALPRCIACHDRERVALPPAPAPTASRDTVAEAMQAHARGAEDLWAGLLFGDADRVERGARQVAASNLVPSGTAASSDIPRLAAEQEVRVQDLADRVARTSDVVRASDAYGRLLGRCAACHAVTEGGPSRSRGRR